MGLFDFLSGGNVANAAKKSAGQQVAGLDESNATLGQARGSIDQALQPYIQSGLRGLGAYEDALGLNGQFAGQQAQQQFQNSPGYQFALDQGVQARNRAAGAGGMALSGAQLKDLQGFGQGLQNQEWGTHLAGLSGLYDAGRQTAVQGQGLQTPLWMQTAQNQTDKGTARAAGTMGAANARQNAFSDVLGFAGDLFGFL